MLLFISIVLLCIGQTTFAQLPEGFDPMKQARVVKRIDIRKIPASGIIRLADDRCTQTAHVAGVRLVYSRNDHKSLQGQDWGASLSYSLLSPQNLDDASAAPIIITSGISLAIGEQTTAPYLQTFITAKTHTLDYSSFNYRHNEAELRIRINGLPTLSNDAPDAIWLELELYESTNLPFNPATNDYHFTARSAGSDIVTAWDYVETAYEYELEWVWIDDAEIGTHNPNFDPTWETTNPEKIFEYREGVTVQTTDQYFIFPNTFLKGRVYYRIRAIGRFMPEDVPQYGEWNYGYDKYYHTKKQAITISTEDYQTSHNWQSVTSFAENAKYKTVVSYHDGTGRNRQVVTHLSSEKRTLIAETLYDYEGNPTVNILPTVLEGTDLSYHENLNPFEGDNPFSKKHYDNSEVASSKLSTTSGAAQYYSANNTSSSRFAERLPDAEGFAYSRSTYLRDGTGRVREQGGLGATYQVGTDHSTKMYYGSATTAELKRLFGNNVGKASFYRKQITQDPNGQLSVSYLDAAGQVVATALTGKKPENVEKLESYVPRTIDVDLKDNNIADTLNRRLVSENTIFNGVPGTEYTFNYQMKGKASSFMDRCLSCQYELSISIYDENGEGIEFIDPTTNQVFATGLFTQTIDPINCNTGNFSVEFKTILPEIGAYQVRKQLQVISNEEINEEITQLISSFETQTQTQYKNEILANNPCDICFTCITEENATGLFEGGDCESILTQIQVAVDQDPATYPTLESHPEYCHYEACIEMSNSKTFHIEMSRISDWTEAETAYGLPSGLPIDRRQALEQFIDQDPLFILYPSNTYSYRNDFVDILMNLKTFSGSNLEDDAGNPISIWEFIDPNNTLTTHSQLFFRGKSMPYDGVDMNDNAAVIQRKWEVFQSRYLYEYELIKKKILENENFAPNNAPCPYLTDQDNAIVKDPTLKIEGVENQDDIDDFGEDVGNATLPNCDLQVQLWLGQLQNACDNPSVNWNSIESQLRAYCEQIPADNPMHTLIEDHPMVINIFQELLPHCPTIVADTENLFQPENCNVRDLYTIPQDTHQSPDDVVDLWMTPLQADITMPDFNRRDLTIQYFRRNPYINISDGRFRVGNIIFLDGVSVFDIHRRFLIGGKQVVFDGTNYSNWFHSLYGYFGNRTKCTLETLTIRYDNGNIILSLYIDDRLFDTQIVSEADVEPLSHKLDPSDTKGKMIVGLLDIVNIRSGGHGTFRRKWDIKIWEGVRSQAQISTDAGIPIAGSNPATTLLAHWPLKGGNLNNIAANPIIPSEKARRIPYLIGFQGSTIESPISQYQAPIRWEGNCCNPSSEDLYEPETIVIEDKKQECLDRFEEIAKKDAQVIIDRKKNEYLAQFTANYTHDCLETREYFNYSYETLEHHYTLYYYDQAGNLVQTVSPEGVRADGTDNHKLKTRYAYNSLNAPTDQETPDAGKSTFFYDKVARIRLSQNAQQEADEHYSYTKYDKQGRIIEVGQLEGRQDGDALVTSELLELVDELEFPNQTDYILTQITRTYYDEEVQNTPSQIAPKNLRGRIAAVKVFEDGQNQGAATFYDYDIHGNVEKLVQSLPELTPKTVAYDYDLLSGNVHKVIYQKGEEDQFMHRYRYDADNRLEAVFTSSDGYIWDEDARYLYYAHGPMARVELGEYKVQGLDYYYTLQGWIKGVNLEGDHDAESGNVTQQYVSKDAFSYALHYYQDDYKSIRNNFGWNSSNTTQDKDLYNGNIASMKTTLSSLGSLVRNYKYDQLHRIREANSINNAYKETFTYDANGNIKTNTLHDRNGTQVDDATYHYFAETNKLSFISDIYGEITAGFDLMNQTGGKIGNFAYDLIGNLVRDRAMEVTQISWTAYHKREQVVKQDGTTITYRYDAMNNRIYKKVEGQQGTETTHYLRDGTGNTLAIYKNGQLEELNIYGSSRIGTYNGKTNEGKRTLGNKRYELSNHLGNALVVVTDNKIGIDSDADLVADSYIALVVSERDYLAFGAVMAGRSVENEGYTYSFNGKELDPSTGWQDYGFRDYNPVYKRFDRVDPLTDRYPELTPYQFASNTPIQAIDLDGLEMLNVTIDIYQGGTNNPNSGNVAIEITASAIPAAVAGTSNPNILQQQITGLNVSYRLAGGDGTVTGQTIYTQSYVGANAQNFGVNANNNNPALQAILQQAQNFYLNNVRYSTQNGSTNMYTPFANRDRSSGITNSNPLIFDAGWADTGDNTRRRLSGGNTAGTWINAPNFAQSGSTTDINFSEGITQLISLSNNNTEVEKLIPFVAHLWLNPSSTLTINPYIPNNADPNAQKYFEGRKQWLTYNSIANDRVKNLVDQFSSWLGSMFSVDSTGDDGFSQTTPRGQQGTTQTSSSSDKVTVTVD